MKLESLINQCRLEVDEISVGDLKERCALEKPPLIIDVREKEELLQTGKIKDAHFLSKGVLECQIERLAPVGDEAIVLYCRSGTRSLIAGYSLFLMGYENVCSLSGGFNAWALSGLPTDAYE